MHSTWNGPKKCVHARLLHTIKIEWVRPIFSVWLWYKIFAHTIFGSCLAHALRPRRRRPRYFHLEWNKNEWGATDWALSQSGRKKSLHKFYAPTYVGFPAFPLNAIQSSREHYKLKALDILSVRSYKAYINIWHFCVETVAHSGMIVLLQAHRAHESFATARNGRAEWIGKPQRWKTFDYLFSNGLQRRSVMASSRRYALPK